jgi:hypothetical protein
MATTNDNLTPIPAYAPTLSKCALEYSAKDLKALGGWNAFRKMLGPFANPGEREVDELLWNMTEAVEGGKVTRELFLFSFFGDRKAVNKFADRLDEYNENGWWLNERFYQAFERALNANEEDLQTFSTLADAMRAKADEEHEVAKKQRRAAAKKAPAKKAAKSA